MGTAMAVCGLHLSVAGEMMTDCLGVYADVCGGKQQRGKTYRRLHSSVGDCWSGCADACVIRLCSRNLFHSCHIYVVVAWGVPSHVPGVQITEGTQPGMSRK